MFGSRDEEGIESASCSDEEKSNGLKVTQSMGVIGTYLNDLSGFVSPRAETIKDKKTSQIEPGQYFQQLSLEEEKDRRTSRFSKVTERANKSGVHEQKRSRDGIYDQIMKQQSVTSPTSQTFDNSSKFKVLQASNQSASHSSKTGETERIPSQLFGQKSDVM